LSNPPISNTKVAPANLLREVLKNKTGMEYKTPEEYLQIFFWQTRHLDGGGDALAKHIQL
jgi:hypothetical protein